MDAAPTSNSDVLDPSTVAGLRKAQAEFGNPSFIRQLVGLYRTNAPRRVEQIRDALAKKDAATLTLVAHTLKSNCSMLGAMTMAKMCATLEEAGENASFDGTAAVLADLDAELVRVLAALDQLLLSDRGAGL